MEAAEKGLGRLEGVLSAKAQGFRSPEKFYYDLIVKEGKALLPAELLAYQKKNLPDYDFVDLHVKGLVGDVENGLFTARGSKQRYRLKPPREGTSKLKVSGKVTQGEKGDPEIEVTEAVEIK